MLETKDILETINMIDNENLDVQEQLQWAFHF